MGSIYVWEICCFLLEVGGGHALNNKYPILTMRDKKLFSGSSTLIPLTHNLKYVIWPYFTFN